MSNPQEEVYKEFLNYDWDSFIEFQEGVKEILDNYLENMKESDPSVVAIPALDKQQLVEQAKSFFFCTKTDHILNLDDFEQWKLHNGDKYARSNQIEQLEEKEEQKEEEVSEQPEYSSNYQELVEMIVSGKQVPGIKEIPNTVLADQVSKAEGKQRLKPWEKAASDAASASSSAPSEV